jgi:hypothetical protein
MQDIVSEEYVSPEQFFTLSRESQRAWNGERRLLLAVFEHAIQEFFKYRQTHTRRGERLFKEVTEWIWFENNNWLYSFENICAYLDFDPEAIRQAIRQRLQDDGADGLQFSCPRQTPRHQDVSSSRRLRTAA